jgi:hypothetical protein
LAHPLKAGFREVVLNLKYQPTEKLSFNARMFSIKSGQDSLGTNLGYNLNVSSRSNTRNINNSVGQGATYNTLLFAFDASYQIRHNMFIDFKYFYRNKDSIVPSLDSKTQFFGGGIRMNIAQQRMEF